jgi:hypothetical protein
MTNSGITYYVKPDLKYDNIPKLEKMVEEAWVQEQTNNCRFEKRQYDILNQRAYYSQKESDQQKCVENIVVLLT